MSDEPYVTKTGKVLSEDEIQRLADEAEQGYADRIHKAAPADDELHCEVCGQRIKRVPGGQGPTWIHADTGAVAAPNPPRQS
jgi:hypothetical protein